MMPSLFYSLAACLGLAKLFSGVEAQGQPPTATNNTGPLSQYKSRPDIYAPFLNITTYEEGSVTPGYIFLGPYQTFQEGIAIYDTRGHLVYSGYGSTGGGPSHNFHVCSISGVDNLCFLTGGQNVGYSRGWAVILDDSFTARSSIHSQGGLANLDEHEFNVLPDGTALFALYSPEPYDLTAYGVATQGWIQNTYFQHIDLDTNRLIFEWSPLDHISLNESLVLMSSSEVAGDGLTPTTPWDFFHLNSIDRNSDGDYLMSARHTSTIYKISGRDGHIIWRLGGMLSDFTFSAGLNFSSQHDARFREENETTTIISLFDNASNGFNQTADYSAGFILRLDHTTQVASLVQEFIAPNRFISASQGNIQLLGSNSNWRNSNAFIGWGSNAYISEYTPDGRMVLEGHFATTGSMSYRAFKHNFTSSPRDAPALYAYAHNESAATTFWVSWNGATKVDRWRIYTSESTAGPWSIANTFDKNGFETQLTVPEFHPWSLVESLDIDGNPLKNSSRPVRTFVPGPQLAAACDALACSSVTTSANSQSTQADTSSTEGPSQTVAANSTVTETTTVYLTPTSSSGAASGKEGIAIPSFLLFVVSLCFTVVT